MRAGRTLLLLLLAIGSPAFAVAAGRGVVHNVVLGRSQNWVRSDIEQLERQLDGLSYQSWKAHGLTRHDPKKDFWKAFPQAVKNAVTSGGRIRFDLTGLSVYRLLREGSDAERVPYGKVTAWELQHLRRDPKLLAATDFYTLSLLGFTKLSPRMVAAFGIVPLPTRATAKKRG